jgi:4a-hydroxytetrahydrobiopterin dehydratase
LLNQDFKGALEFTNQVGKVAEAMGHHPDMLIHSYNKVKIRTSTYLENTITDKDHELAEKIDDLK